MTVFVLWGGGVNVDMFCVWNLTQYALFKFHMLVQLCTKEIEIFVYYFWLLLHLIYAGVLISP